jgi:hypothetical protein
MQQNGLLLVSNTIIFNWFETKWPIASQQYIEFIPFIWSNVAYHQYKIILFIWYETRWPTASQQYNICIGMKQCCLWQASNTTHSIGIKQCCFWPASKILVFSKFAF